MTIDAGARARSPRSRSSTTSVMTLRPEPSISKAYVSTLASNPSFRRGSGMRKTVREGCCSAMSASTRSAFASHSFGAHTRWVMTLVRSFPGSRCALSAFSTAESDVSVSVSATSARPDG